MALLAILMSGCGSSGTGSPGEGSTKTAPPHSAAARACAVASADVEGLRVSEVSCAEGRHVAAGWATKNACATPADASRTSCAVGGYRCLGVATERGLTVDCAHPGRSVSFIFIRS